MLANELGRPSHAGLLQLGLDPSRILFVETPRAAEALVGLEEGLKSASIALAIGVFHELDLTPARRLSLAAGEKKYTLSRDHSSCVVTRRRDGNALAPRMGAQCPASFRSKSAGAPALFVKSRTCPCAPAKRQSLSLAFGMVR